MDIDKDKEWQYVDMVRILSLAIINKEQEKLDSLNYDDPNYIREANNIRIHNDDIYSKLMQVATYLNCRPNLS